MLALMRAVAATAIHRRSRGASGVATVVLGMLFAASAVGSAMAAAAGNSIRIVVPASPVVPTNTFPLVVTGDSTHYSWVWMTSKPDGAGPCAATPLKDRGHLVLDFSPAWVSPGRIDDGTALFPRDVVGSGVHPGRYLLCAWLGQGSGDTAQISAGPVSAVLTVAGVSAQAQLQIPSTDRPGLLAVFVRYSMNAVEGSLYLDVESLRPAGRRCSTTVPRSPPRNGARLIAGDVVYGHGSYPVNFRSGPGADLLCAWITVGNASFGPFTKTIHVLG